MDIDQPRVSIIIPSYNSFKTLSFVISNLLEQTSTCQVNEIIIVDSSDDGKTKQLLNITDSEKVKVVHAGKKIIPAIQRNIGAKISTGQVLIFIDADIYLERNYLKKILQAYKLGYLAGGGSYLIPEFQRKNKLVVAQYYLNLNEFIDVGKARIKKLLPCGNLFCDRNLFFKIGGFPEIRASEDCIFTLQLSKHNELLFIPDAKVYHIFKENKKQYLQTQLVLGKYIYVYRKLYFNSFYLKGILPVILSPIIVLAKFLRIYMRTISAGNHHISMFNKSLLFITLGLTYWGKGFVEGIFSYKKLI